mgnify:CR=1 FL=1|tara:strand:- start:19012 stop:19401 length:390 start_codon:yes stop_codon:yes gene_type:complete
MGLDHGLIAYKGRNRKQIDFKYNPSEEINIITWRKHPYLHGWFDDLYAEKGGDAYTNALGGFNGHELQVTDQDFLELQTKVITGTLKQREGFFWGNNACQHYKERDLDCIDKAMDYIKKGYKIKYWAWW